MGITIRNGTIALTVLGAAIAALAASPGAGAAARSADASVIAGTTSAAAQQATRRYWTPARMAAAEQADVPQGAAPGPAKRPMRRLVRDKLHYLVRVPAGAAPARTARSVKPDGPWLTGNTAGAGLRWTHGGTVAKAVGKVFFTLGEEDYVCSGTTVAGQQADVVLTAAHCVSGGPRAGGKTQWATNWMFVPGFNNGQMPYGEYTARRFFVSPGWTGPSGGREQYDVAFVQVATDELFGPASPAAPGGLPVKFAKTQRAVALTPAYVFGYPALAPYTGLFASYCAGRAAAHGGSQRTTCTMTAGDSGGPWLAGFRPRPGQGTVVAVTTYKLAANMNVLYGAVLGPQAKLLYERAVS